MLIKQLKFAAIALVMLTFGSGASASLIGQTVNCDFQPDKIWTCSPTSATVTDPGTEFQLNLPNGLFFSVDFGPSSVLLTLVSEGSLGMNAGEILTFSGLGGLLGASLGFSQATGFDGSDISFTTDSLQLVLNETSWSPGQQALINLAMASVPEPSTLALLSLGLGAIFLSRRRR